MQAMVVSLIPRHRPRRSRQASKLGNDEDSILRIKAQGAKHNPRTFLWQMSFRGTTFGALKYLLRLMKAHKGELSITFIRGLLERFGINCGHHGKVNNFL